MIVTITRDVILGGVTYRKGSAFEIASMEKFDGVYMAVVPQVEKTAKVVDTIEEPEKVEKTKHTKNK